MKLDCRNVDARVMTALCIVLAQPVLCCHRSSKDSCLFLVREHDPQALSKSFDELKLFDEEQADDMLTVSAHRHTHMHTRMHTHKHAHAHTHTPPSPFRLSLFGGSVAPNRDGVNDSFRWFRWRSMAGRWFIQINTPGRPGFPKVLGVFHV